jgi:hypothetical protein
MYSFLFHRSIYVISEQINHIYSLYTRPRTYRFPVSNVLFQDPRQKPWIEVSLYLLLFDSYFCFPIQVGGGGRERDAHIPLPVKRILVHWQYDSTHQGAGTLSEHLLTSNYFENRNIHGKNVLGIKCAWFFSASFADNNPSATINT